MKIFTDRGVGVQLGLGFGTIVAMLCVLAAGSVLLVSSMENSLPNEELIARQRCAINFRGSVHDRAISLRDLVLIRDDAELAPVLNEIDELTRNYSDAEQALASLLGNTSNSPAIEAEILERIRKTDKETRPIIDEVRSLRLAGENEAAHALLLSEARPLFVRWLKEINEHIDWAEETNQAATLAARENAAGIRVFMIVFAGVSAAAGIGIALLISRTLSRPLTMVSSSLAAIAEGDLTQPTIQTTNRGEIGRLAASAASLSNTLRSIISDVAGAANSVAQGVTTIRGVMGAASTNVNAQSQEISQVAAATQEMSASLTEVAAKTQEASGAAQDSGRQAEQGREAVRLVIDDIRSIDRSVSQASTTVDDLGTKSEQIGTIVTVINDIADQTNLLALNAAIEAARAGEHGRGFAVVADEVRKLAERTTAATDEINASIAAIRDEIGRTVTQMRDGTEQVARGVDGAQNADNNLQQIYNSATAVAQMVASISAATDEQTSAAEQVSALLERISRIGEETLHKTTSAAEATNELVTNSEQLQALVSKFRI